MRDPQIATFLETWSGFARGVISSEKPNEQVTLSEILESETSARYYLSPKAATGILRRAEKRGKELPQLLARALKAVAGSEQTLTATVDLSLNLSGGGNTSGPIDAAACLTAKGQRIDFEVETFVAQQVAMPPEIAGTMKACGGKSGLPNGAEEADRLIPVCYGLSTQQEPKWAPDLAPTLAMPSKTGGGQVTAVAFDLRGREGGAQFEGPHDTANIRAASGGSSRSYVAQQWAVRRLTPKCCERLQGFPDGYTAIPDANGKTQADGPRYRQLGNSWAVPVISWLGKRIAECLPV